MQYDVARLTAENKKVAALEEKRDKAQECMRNVTASGANAGMARVWRARKSISET